jgi:riboflavin kinase/FMN adenylyltransferase
MQAPFEFSNSLWETSRSMTDSQQPTSRFVVVRDPAPADDVLKGAVLAIGNFDGVHRGHRAVIGAARERARSLGRKAAALTFEPHPRTFFRPEESLFRLTDETAKLRLLAGAGLDGTVVMTFDADLAGLSAHEFVRGVLVERFRVAGVTIGFDFHFGKGRAGAPAMLAESGEQYGFKVDVVPQWLEAGRAVSTGAIRSALAAGHVSEATALLGYPWFVTGEVVHGDQRGREFGFPTANLRLDPSCGLRHGVYAVRVGIDGVWRGGVANFGRRPMFDTGAVLLEVFLFDFSGDLYGNSLDVAFVAWIRPELHFDSNEALIRRMDDDRSQARAALKRAGDILPPLGNVAA